MKIDYSYVQDLESREEARILCESMIVMAHKLGIEVIAEGIETENQRSILQAMGCDYGQGFCLFPPLSATNFEQRILKQERMHIANHQNPSRIELSD